MPQPQPHDERDERDQLVLDCVNFERQLLRCHELAVQRSVPADPPSLVEQDDDEDEAEIERRVRETRRQLVLDQVSRRRRLHRHQRLAYLPTTPTDAAPRRPAGTAHATEASS